MSHAIRQETGIIWLKDKNAYPYLREGRLTCSGRAGWLKEWASGVVIVGIAEYSNAVKPVNGKYARRVWYVTDADPVTYPGRPREAVVPASIQIGVQSSPGRRVDTAEADEWIRTRASSSPVSGLYNYFSASPYAVAPERTAELKNITKDLDVRIALRVAEPGFNFKAVTRDGKRSILIGLITLEKLWAFSYGYSELIFLLQNKPQGMQHKVPAEVSQLLAWAHFSPNVVYNPWPKSLPRPDIAGSGRSIKQADEMFLCMSAWMLLHEVGHFIRQDVSSPVDYILNYENEFGADAWAYKLMLGQWQAHKKDDGLFIKRSLAVGLALFIFSANQMVSLGGLESQEHPSPIQRLRRYLNYLKAAYGYSHADAVDLVEVSVVNMLFYALDVSLKMKGGDAKILERKWDLESCLELIEKQFERDVLGIFALSE